MFALLQSEAGVKWKCLKVGNTLKDKTERGRKNYDFLFYINEYNHNKI